MTNFQIVYTININKYYTSFAYFFLISMWRHPVIKSLWSTEQTVYWPGAYNSVSTVAVYQPIQRAPTTHVEAFWFLKQ